MLTPPASPPSRPAAQDASGPAGDIEGGLGGFLSANARWLGAGALMTFASSFGQTFFISLSAGEIRGEFGLSHGEWGGIYTLGTLASAATMLWAGGLADRVRAGRMAGALMALLAGACLVMAASPVAAALVGAVFLLRLFGQGMLYHTAMVCMGRWFARRRGRAVAIAGLGIAVGEALLPLGFVALTGLVGWRGGWIAAACLALALAPLAPLWLRRERRPGAPGAASETPGLGGRHWTRPQALRHWLFLATFPAFLAQPVFSTAFFFQQAHLADIKGWTLAQFVALFPLYVAAAIPMTFLGGWIVDRVGARRAAPAWPLLLALALGAASFGQGLAAAAAIMALMGAMQGYGSAVAGAWWPEIYGTRHLGAIRAAAASVMVFATALGPGSSGMLIDAGVGLETQLSGMSLYSLLMAGVFRWVDRRAGRDPDLLERVK